MAKKKKKSRLKKFLKGAALAGAAALGASALGKRNRNAMIKSADANDGFRTPFTRPNMLDIAGGIPDRNRGTILPRSRMMTPQDMANDPFFTGAETLMNDTRMFKKGGRVGCGIAKKGFGRALKKGGK